MSQSKQKIEDNILKTGFFQRSIVKRQFLNVSDYMTFKNIVIALGVGTFFIFLGSVVSARMAFLFAALSMLTGLVIYEMATRRAWEAEILEQFRRMSGDYDRIVRDVARNRNDMAVLKKNLSTAGTLARSYGDMPGGAVEQRMVSALADQLSRLGAPALEEGEGEDRFSVFGIGAVEKDAALSESETEVLGTRLTDDQVLQLVNAAVRQDRIDLFMQPIVNLPQRKTRFFEMFSRIRIKPNVYLPAERYIEVAMEQDLIPVIDNLLLLRSLQLIRDTEEENFNRAFFCNITSVTLHDPKFMGDLVEFVSQNRTLAPRIIFELSQHDLSTMGADMLPILDGLAKIGCRFSMDQVRNLSFDFAFLAARHVRFVKVEGTLVLREMHEQGGFQRMKRLKSEMDANGIDVIVEKIETERSLLELLDLEIDYGQGYLFGKPDLSSYF